MGKDKIAILVDGGFYRRRAKIVWGEKSAEDRVDEMMEYCYKHLSDKRAHKKYELYRLFYYDCPPMERTVYHPFLKKNIDFRHTDLHTWMIAFLEKMTFRRKVALRLGDLAESQARYVLSPEALKGIMSGKVTLEDLTEKDFLLDVKQKGVDMKIGIDIASISYKHQVEKIVLISGDSDFIPAAKLARREGIDFVLDPLWHPIKPSLQEHVDGVISCIDNPKDEKGKNLK